MRDYRKIYIDGDWIRPSGGQVADVINPATEQPAGQITLAAAADADRAVAAARTAFRTFSQTSRAERVELLSNILAAYAERQRDLADALVEELGAPVSLARGLQAQVGFLHLQTGIEV